MIKQSYEAGRREFEADFELGKKKKGQNPENPFREDEYDSTAPFVDKEGYKKRLEKRGAARWTREAHRLSDVSLDRLQSLSQDRLRRLVSKAKESRFLLNDPKISPGHFKSQLQLGLQSKKEPTLRRVVAEAQQYLRDPKKIERGYRDYQEERLARSDIFKKMKDSLA